jgi:heme-degrading monooxygenase HmoA
MHIAVVNFRLKNMTHEQFTAACDELAPAYAAIPGLVSKVWLGDPTGNTYGGVYTWQDLSAFQAFTRSDLARSVMTHPNFTDVVVRDFTVLEGPTRVTRGLR